MRAYALAALAGALALAGCRSLEPAEARLAALEPRPGHDCYALLVAGNEERFCNNVGAVFGSLCASGIAATDIYILGPEEARLPGAGVATPQSVEAALSKLATVADAEDTVVVYVASHGGSVWYPRLGTHSSISLPHGELNAAGFRAALAQFRDPLVVAVVNSCESYPFIADLGPRCIGVSSSAPGGISHSTARDSFGSQFFRALTDRAADLNHDSATSVIEQYIYACERHELVSKGTDTPVLLSALNPAAVTLHSSTAEPPGDERFVVYPLLDRPAAGSQVRGER